MLLKAAASCFVVLCNFNLVPPPIEAEEVRGAFNVLPPALKGTTAYVTGRGGGWSRGVLAEWRSIIHTHYVVAVFLQLSFVCSPFRTLILLFRLHLCAVSQRLLD